ncbi:hypothetical protein F2Q70_00033867 [Brassica cretica]|uniref:Demeter RRM-fold domain-containing protein n=1 Tax=Brassica cretica TaxID=69181 RepID=A0A8S9JP90_BRACR|nr:hypothetical protein F2Q70_00033867 [Brassica cretica]
MQDFLNRVRRDHNNGLDLEWLRRVEPHKSKQYLLSFLGLGTKCVDCVRLLTLHQRAFPVDINIARIAVRLGWVPVLVEGSLQVHHIDEYPELESVQKYLLPRLCNLDQETLYELHYQMITFGKVFCTKREPNCKACPMRGECKHFASACGKWLVLPNSEKDMETSDKVSPELKCPQISIGDIEDVPTIRLNKDGSTRKVKEIIKHNKYISSLKTEHEVYVLPDSHHLLAEFPKREIDDPNSYLLAIWTPGSLEVIKDHQIPCRTAMENRFPLNGTFFQINEVFADHDSSINPIDVPRAWLCGLVKRTVHFGTTVADMFKGLSTKTIQQCFSEGNVCFKGFERTEKRTTTLIASLYLERKMESRVIHKEQEEYGLRLKEAFEKEEENRRMREAREKAENERIMKVAFEQEKERKIKEVREKEENEGRIKEAREKKAAVERRMKETLEQEEKERRIKELQEREAHERRVREALEKAENQRKLKEAREKEENEKKLREAIELEEKGKRLIEAFERAKTERRLKEELEEAARGQGKRRKNTERKSRAPRKGNETT